MKIPANLKHKPVIICDNYENIDGRRAYQSEAKGLSLGLAQWNDRGKVDISAKRKNQQLNSLFDLKEDIRVMFDKDRIEQVMLNILSNAIKYTHEGGRIDIDIKASASDVTISVEDNGIGIPEQDLGRVFDRFYRVDKARSRSVGGTGLGLAISKQIVEEHMGTIRAEKARSRGTRFVLTLPRSVHKGVPNIE